MIYTTYMYMYSLVMLHMLSSAALTVSLSVLGPVRESLEAITLSTKGKIVDILS